MAACHCRQSPRTRRFVMTGDHDALISPLPGHSSNGRLERVLRRGEFAVTAELNPPDSADPSEVFERAAVFDGWVDGINATDGSGANCHMSSVGVSGLLTRVGYAPVMQISCRDHNRIWMAHQPPQNYVGGDISFARPVARTHRDAYVITNSLQNLCLLRPRTRPQCFGSELNGVIRPSLTNRI